MPRDINKRLEQLQSRRRGLDRLGRIETAAQDLLKRDSILKESWQKRAAGQPYTRYALGAMQSVERRYTEIGIETATRVGNQLAAGLAAAGMPVDFRLQGSVPLDVHIRGVSDVDLLTLDQGFLTYAQAGRKALIGGNYWPTTKTSLGVLAGIRRESESILKAKFPAATVDCSGGKAIAISGGSLARPVDVVPSHWNDTVNYQATGQDHDRGVTILDKKVPTTVDNLPFLHIKRIHDRDALLNGGLKKAIRLCKNVKNDAEVEGTTIALPSFDIAALLYHADQATLRLAGVYELAVLNEAQRFLDWCYANPDQAKTLMTPDGSRPIINSDEKRAAVLLLSSELDDLAREVAKEQSVALRTGSPTWGQINETLQKSYIPAATL